MKSDVYYISEMIPIPIISCNYINNEANFILSGINSAVKIYKTTLSVHWESVTMWRGFVKSISTMRMAYNSNFCTNYKGF